MAAVPAVLNLELTNRCNLECGFCDHPVLKRRMALGEMPVPLLERLLDGLGDTAVYELGLVGLGEPLLDRLLAEHLAAVDRRRHLFTRISMNSNAVALTAAKARTLLESPVNLVTFSLNATSREAYRRMMLADKFEAAVANIRRFMALRLEAGRRDLKLSVQFMTSRLNEEAEMRRLFAEYLDDDVIVYNRYVFHKPVLDGDTEHLVEVNQADFANRHPCWSMYSRLYVDIDGNVYPCTIGNDSYRGGSGLVIGNLAEAGILDIFAGAPIAAARQRAEDNRLPFAECRSCTLWQLFPNHFRFEAGRWVHTGVQDTRRPELDRND